MKNHMNMEFFNNKRLLVVLSGVACILIAFVIFVVSLIGFGNIGAFLNGGSSYVEPTPEKPASSPTISTQGTPTPTLPEGTPPGASASTGFPQTTPPITDSPTETVSPTDTEGTTSPTDTGIEDPTPTPEIPVNSIEIVQGMNYSMTAGNALQLTVRFLPENATNKTVTWESSNKNVAVVDNNGYVVAMAAGEARITVRASGTQGVFAQITITVTPAAVLVENIAFDQDVVRLNVGDAVTLTPNIYPSSAANGKTLNWRSSNSAVATVSSDGRVTAVGAGTAQITVTVDGKTANIRIEVAEPATPPPTETEEPTPTPEPTPEPTSPATEEGPGGSEDTEG